MAYSTQADVNGVFGADNVNLWAKVNNDDDASDIATNVTSAIEWADAEIDGLFTNGPYPIPFSPVPRLVREWSATLAGVYVYRKRGFYDDDDEVGGKLEKLKKKVYREMRWFVSGSWRLQETLTHDGPTAPVVVGTAGRLVPNSYRG